MSEPLRLTIDGDGYGYGWVVAPEVDDGRVAASH
jgi:hypothetical protein